ncbi:hypothetical protein Q7P37_005827 [Cladosporium fusiforme]
MSDTERRRSRSRSPRRDDSRPKKQKTGGFKWKDKRPAADSQGDKATSDDRSLRRGYRDRSPRRDNYSQRERERDDDRNRDRDRDRSPRRRDRDNGGDSYRPSRDDARKHDDPLDRVSSSNRDRPTPTSEKPEKKDKPKKAPKLAAPSEPMIIVNVNDRLGTKAAIPCLASDSVKAFKAIVAAHVGRQPHEIMLKRQGERPFKDILSLADYGVSSGVQLDLEIDTGD